MGYVGLSMNDNSETSESGIHPVWPIWKLRGLVWFVLIQLAVVSVILVCVELLLMLMGIQRLDTQNEKPPSTYPKSPDEYVKIAIFGGSAAAGTYSPRGLHDILEYELKKRYPDKRFYVKNYASHGEPFHHHQAEYAKRLVNKYDFLLIYCGNNEAENWYDDSGYWRKPQFKDAKDLVFAPPPDAPSSAALSKTRTWLTRHSRIFSVASGVKDRFQPPVTKNRNRNYAEYEREPSLPLKELDAIVTNFETDIREICDLARRHGKQVLLSTAATFETWPPSYSTFAPGISESEKQSWNLHQAEGLRQFELFNYQDAIIAFESAADIDSTVAILNYRLGMSYLRLGESTKGRDYLRKAIDGEGHYFRTHTSLHSAAKKLAGATEQLHYVDVVDAFHQAVEGEIQDEDLFVDVCHPSFLGYVIMAHTFLDRLMQLNPFVTQTVVSNVVTDVVWKSLAAQRYRDLNVLPDEDKVAIASNILYCFDLMHYCAYPERCIEQIEKHLARIDSFGQEDPMAKTFNAVCRARLAIRELDVETGMDEINNALQTSPEYLNKILDLKAWDHYIEDEFIEVGIEYSREKNLFVLRGVPEMS